MSRSVLRRETLSAPAFPTHLEDEVASGNLNSSRPATPAAYTEPLKGHQLVNALKDWNVRTSNVVQEIPLAVPDQEAVTLLTAKDFNVSFQKELLSVSSQVDYCHYAPESFSSGGNSFAV